MRTKTFILKVLRYISIILLLSTLLVLALKNRHPAYVECHTHLWGDIHLQNWMFLFLFYARLLATYILTHFIKFDKLFLIPWYI